MTFLLAGHTSASTTVIGTEVPMENSMAVVEPGRKDGAGAVATSRKWIVAYWVFTLFIAFNQLWAGVSDVLRAEPLFGVLLHLGYPPHLATILGVWKLLAAVALLAPGYPLLKEWAYAGLFFDFSTAVVAHATAGDGVVWFVGPVLSIGALVMSWYLRPPSRRLAETRARQLVR
jgi:hypothetical protein